MTEDTTRVWTFSNGTEFDVWSERNCERCSKMYDPETLESLCDLEVAIFEAGAGDGTVSKEIADRLGWKPNDVGHDGRCPEFDAAGSSDRRRAW